MIELMKAGRVRILHICMRVKNIKLNTQIMRNPFSKLPEKPALENIGKQKEWLSG